MAKEKNLLKSILGEEGITQEELAQASNLSVRTVGKVCNEIRISASSKRKLVKGLNSLTSTDKFSIKDIFPF